jgi:hypothetical protein
LVIEPLRAELGGALSPCFENCISETIRIAGPHPDGDKIEIVFDKGIESPRLHRIADNFTRVLGTHAWVRVVRFAKVQETLGLQSADVMATEAYWHGEQWIRQGDSAKSRAHLRHMLANLRCESVILGRQEIEDVLRRLGSDADCYD